MLKIRNIRWINQYRRWQCHSVRNRQHVRSRQRRILPAALRARSLRLMTVKETAMTTIDHTTPTARFATRPAIGGASRAMASPISTARWKNRREFYRLGEMSDAELADIGLTRADLHVAVRASVRRRPDGLRARARSVAAARRGRGGRGPLRSAEASNRSRRRSPLHAGSRRSPAIARSSQGTGHFRFGALRDRPIHALE